MFKRTIITLILFVPSLTVLFFAGCGGPGLTKRWPIKEYYVDEYKIVYAKELGPVGLPYYVYNVYKNEKYIASTYVEKNDTCKLIFSEKSDYYLTLDLCNKTKTILQPNKADFEINQIDSITIRLYDSIRVVNNKTYKEPFYDTIHIKNFDPLFSKSLTKDQIKEFVHLWNNSYVEGYEMRGSVSFDYIITVYERGIRKQLVILNKYIYDDRKWSYIFSDVNFFDKIWNNE